MKIFFSVCVLIGCAFSTLCAQQKNAITIGFNADSTYQTIHNFGRFRCMERQFVGNWPDGKKNAIADWLFSMDTLQTVTQRV
jgi:hypothetical protein